MLAYVYAAAGVSVWLEDGGGRCWERMGMCWMLPWTLSALVVGGAAAGRGHVITGHTAPVTTTRDQTIVHG